MLQALGIGRASGITGHSFVRSIYQFRHCSDDLMTLTDVGRSADQMRSDVAIIPRPDEDSCEFLMRRDPIDRGIARAMALPQRSSG